MYRLPLLVAVVAVASGCSGGGNPESERFVRHADAICGEFARQVARVPPPSVSLKLLLGHSQRARAAQRLLLAYDRRIDRLGDPVFAKLSRLRAPLSLRSRWRRWLAHVHAARRTRKRAVLALLRNEVPARGNPGAAWRAHSRAAEELARDLGLRRCATDVRYR